MDKGLMKERMEERRNGNRRRFKEDWGKEKQAERGWEGRGKVDEGE